MPWFVWELCGEVTCCIGSGCFPRAAKCAKHAFPRNCSPVIPPGHADSGCLCRGYVPFLSCLLLLCLGGGGLIACIETNTNITPARVCSRSLSQGGVEHGLSLAGQLLLANRMTLDTCLCESHGYPKPAETSRFFEHMGPGASRRSTL